MKKLIHLTPEKFAEIYTSEKFRNEVAYAHGCKYEGIPEYRETCSYPDRYVVTDAQIEEAKKELERARLQTVKDNAGKLMFVGMGCTYEPRYQDDVCNHRIRTEFVNVHGHHFFIELGTGRGDQMRIDHSIDSDLQNEYKAKAEEYYQKRDGFKYRSAEWLELNKQVEKYMGQPYNNYKGLEHKMDLPQYTLRNVLKLVNKYFKCNFSEIVIDNYNVTCEDYTSVSPSFSPVKTTAS